MVTKGKVSLNLPHGAVDAFTDYHPLQIENQTLQVVEGVWDSSCITSKYPQDEQEEEIIN